MPPRGTVRTEFLRCILLAVFLNRRLLFERLIFERLI